MSDGLGTPWIWTAGLGGAVLVGLAVVLSAMLDRSGPIRLRHWTEEAGGGLRRLYDQPGRFEFFRFLLALLARIAPLLYLMLLILIGVPGTEGIARIAWLVAAVVSLVLFVELASRVLVTHNPEAVLRRLTGIYRVLVVVLSPLVALLAPLLPQEAVERRESEPGEEATSEEIAAFLSVGAREGILEPGEEDMIQRVIDFGDARVKSVMTPRIDMVCAPVESDLESLARLFLESKHSRIPLYRESVDHVAGVLHVREVFRALREAPDEPASALAVPAYFVPESKPLSALLSELQAGRQQMAIVVDEYGGTAGLVTVEDLLEEIVGEIADEHETEVEPSRELGDGSWLVEGATDLDDLEAIFGVDLESEPYETVGGLIFGHLGFVPEAGAVLEANGLRFTVERVEERRIQSVRVVRSGGARKGGPGG